MPNIHEIITSTIRSQHEMIENLVKTGEIEEYPINQWNSTTLSHQIDDENDDLDEDHDTIVNLLETRYKLDLTRLNQRIKQIWG